MSGPGPVEDLLARVRAHEPGAECELFQLLYSELHAIAQKHMASQRSEHTLQATALVNEAWIKLARGSEREWADRTHFLRLASAAMRQVLVDHARRKSSLKRGAARAEIELEELSDELDVRSGGLVALDEALKRLEARDAQAVRLVEMRFFGGCTMAEAAVVLGVSERQAARSWSAIRLILREELGRG